MAHGVWLDEADMRLLGERVDAKRWALIVLGFVGVLLVVQPSAEGFNAYALLCVFATLLHAARDLLTRRVPAQVPSLIITLATGIFVDALATLAFDPLTARSTARAALTFGPLLLLTDHGRSLDQIMGLLVYRQGRGVGRSAG